MEVLGIFLAAVFVVLAWVISSANQDRANAARAAHAERDREHSERQAARRSAIDSARAAKEAQKAAAESVRQAGPPAVHGRWVINYPSRHEEDQGTVLQRTVRILEVKPIVGRIECWCELRKEKRTFSLGLISQAADAETGEIIDLSEWLETYRLSRRKVRRQEK